MDWDDPNIRGSWAIKKGVKLILYGILVLFRKTNWAPKEIMRETDDYAETMLKINDLLGIETVIGVRDSVKLAKIKTVEKMIEKGYDVRRHTHIGEPPDPNRQRLWDPPLHQTPHTWHYDIDYVAGNRVELLPGELPVWHIDRPHYLKHYIDFLYNEFKGE